MALLPFRLDKYALKEYSFSGADGSLFLLHGSAGMTLLGSNNDDSTVVIPNLGFDFYYNSVNCRTTVNTSGNSWVGFGSATENLKVNRRDAKYQYLYGYPEVIGGYNTYRIRWEGSKSYSATTNDLWWELLLFENSMMGLIIERIPSGVLDGVSSFNTQGNGDYIKAGGWETGKSYIFIPSAGGGTFYTIAT